MSQPSSISSRASGRPIGAGSRLCGCVEPHWRPVLLQLEGGVVVVGGERCVLTPSCEVTAVTAASLTPPGSTWQLWRPGPPSGPAIELQLRETRWALCAANSAERAHWLRALSDAIDLSHGPSSPYATWAFGAQLGSGTFGVVRSVRHRASGDRCACKLISKTFIERHAPAREALEREVRLMESLREHLTLHTAVLRLRETYDYGDTKFLVLAPECNGDLLQLLKAAGKFSEPQAAAATRAALVALAAVHAAGVAHLDVKVQNLLFRQPPGRGATSTFESPAGGVAEVFLGDFGCARAQRHAAPGAPSAHGGWAPLPYDGSGTLYFLPPESLEEEIQGAASDVWAAGCVAFMLLHNRPPFVWEGDSEEMARLRILRASPLFAVPAPRADSPPPSRPSNKPGSSPAGPAATGAATAATSAARDDRSVPLTASARAFLGLLLTRDWRERVSAAEALADPWLQCDRTPVAWGVGMEGVAAGVAAGDAPSPFPVEWTLCHSAARDEEEEAVEGAQ